jgi:hypothetical protein
MSVKSSQFLAQARGPLTTEQNMAASMQVLAAV